MRRTSIVTLVGLLAWFGGPTYSGEKGTPTDNEFLTKFAEANHGEIELAKLADKHAQSERVKEYATKIIRDHQMLHDRLAGLLKTANIGIVAGTDRKIRDEVQRLSKLNAAEFDAAFIKRMVDDHKEAISLFEGQVQNGKNADISSFARDTLPSLRDHLKGAEKLQKEAGR